MACYITSFGVVSCAGIGINDFYNNLLNHEKSLFSQSQKLSNGKIKNVGRVTGSLPAFPMAYGAYYSRTNHLVLAALQQIRDDIINIKQKYSSERIGIIIGTCTSGSTEIDFSREHEQHHGKVPDGYDYSVELMDNVASFAKYYLQIDGPAISVSTACTSSGKAIAMAKRYLDNYMLDAVIVGGADSYALAPLNGFESLASLSDSYCTPFGANRDGINIGEGAALFILSRDHSTLKVLGTGESSDAYHMSSPDPEGAGAELAIRQALEMAKITASDVGYINLHGTGTVANDSMESILVNRMFNAETPCSSTKNITGHTLGAASAIELAACATMLLKGNKEFELIPQYGAYELDSSLPKINLINKKSSTSKPIFLSTSYAFGGSNCCIIVARESDDMWVDAEQYLPHKNAMRFVDKIFITNNGLTAKAKIRKDNPLLTEKGLPAHAGIEYMAQALAGKKGYSNFPAIKNGVIVGVKNINISNEYFYEDKEIHIYTNVIHSENGYEVAECKVIQGEEIISAEIAVMEVNDAIQ